MTWGSIRSMAVRWRNRGGSSLQRPPIVATMAAEKTLEGIRAAVKGKAEKIRDNAWRRELWQALCRQAGLCRCPCRCHRTEPFPKSTLRPKFQSKTLAELRRQGPSVFRSAWVCAKRPQQEAEPGHVALKPIIFGTDEPAAGRQEKNISGTDEFPCPGGFTG